MENWIHRPTRARVHLPTFKDNIQWLLKYRTSPGQKVFATIKANGYGHGAVEIGKVALSAGVHGLAVATVEEAIELREADIDTVPILVLGHTLPEGIHDILKYQLTITVSDTDFFDSVEDYLNKQDSRILGHTKLKVHLAVDTGMSRIGVRTVEELHEFIEKVQEYSWVDWEGAFTHFATAGGGSASYIEDQLAKWRQLEQHLPNSVKERHYANSAMGLWHGNAMPESTIVRFGIAMYGLDPKDALITDEDLPKLQNENLEALKPALEWVTEIVHVKQVPPGTKISYGATYESSENEWIATLPIGYADGWHRHYQTVPVIIEGEYAEIVGTINMDQMMIRLPRYYPKGTKVTLIGKNGHLMNHPSKIARDIGTIGYEILTSIGPRVPRIYLEE
ncbi:alanine racemase [Aerococcaceae bacterium DSM 111020]|nr:alanine racemase [Aerococcaceae bacterium DSM 111020]